MAPRATVDYSSTMLYLCKRAIQVQGRRHALHDQALYQTPESKVAVAEHSALCALPSAQSYRGGLKKRFDEILDRRRDFTET